MSIFRSSGFDTVIGKGAAISGTSFELQPGTTLIEGKVNMDTIKQSQTGTKLMINGDVTADHVEVDELIVNGTLKANTITVKTLAANKGANITAEDRVVYEKPIFQAGAVVNGKLQHSSSLTAEPTQGA